MRNPRLPALRHPGRITGAAAALCLTLAACGGSDVSDAIDEPEPTASIPTASIPTAPTSTSAPDHGGASETGSTEPGRADATPIAPTSVGTTVPTASETAAAPTTVPDAPADDRRIVALAEEFVLADLLALGIEPVASSATVEAAGFQGIEWYDTSDIEVLPMTTLSLEYLASLEPDVIVTLQFWVDEIGHDLLNELADVVVIPDGLTTADQIVAVGDLMGRPEEAAALAADHATATEAAAERVDGDCEVSLATIYAGPNVAAFVEGPWEVPTSILSTGCELDPDGDDAEPDQNGRAWLSLEQLGLLDSDDLILLQTPSVEGEQAAIDEITANPIWQTLPAVRADQVTTFDRLGYPGVVGQINFLDEFATLMADD